MTTWTERSAFATVLMALRGILTVPAIVVYVVIFFIICDPLDRARNVPREFQPPGNGHLTDSTNPLIRGAMSISPPGVMGLQLGLLFACSLVWILHVLMICKEKVTFSIWTAIMELLLGAAGVLPGLMGIYTIQWWGCHNLFYGNDPENATENSRGASCCRQYNAATYLFTIMGGAWLIALVLDLVMGLYGAGRRVVKRDDIELNRPYRNSNNQASTGPQFTNPPEYTAPTGYGNNRKW